MKLSLFCLACAGVLALTMGCNEAQSPFVTGPGLQIDPDGRQPVPIERVVPHQITEEEWNEALQMKKIALQYAIENELIGDDDEPTKLQSWPGAALANKASADMPWLNFPRRPPCFYRGNDIYLCYYGGRTYFYISDLGVCVSRYGVHVWDC